MKQTKNNQTGNVVLGFLIVATIAIIAMMAVVYRELARTPEITAEAYEKQKQVELMSPDGKAGDKPVYRTEDGTSKQPTVRQAVADEAEKIVDVAPQSNTDLAVVNVTTSKKAVVNKSVSKEKVVASNKQAISTAGLQEVDAPKPIIREQVEHQTTPTANKKSENKVVESSKHIERVKSSGNNGSIDELF